MMRENVWAVDAGDAANILTAPTLRIRYGYATVTASVHGDARTGSGHSSEPSDLGPSTASSCVKRSDGTRQGMPLPVFYLRHQLTFSARSRASSGKTVSVARNGNEDQRRRGANN
ncbi:hypothetical protein CORC01_12651 [Colletotrichum orchidophilum]|uniref:Uncharacterized protein n=1 Tax=Colletotrichum orchidophilum TaxID=1209926 RepID=A0A1G4ASE0_9PEZI|nr:uncharacterized protein CORC01_12651 [Colletotrichum orchidophilum]OHE92070.1 hypothetical protein CORC01_12651 [Colletotrichum orchidophilum]